MEEVDRIIIHTLRDIGCDIDEDIYSLGQFTSTLFIDATVRCLEVINSEISLPKTLPQNMAAKFHVCASIAESCKAEGYSGEIGYQTFLYSSGSEVRRVLMFLIDKLPRESETTTVVAEDSITKLKLAVSRILKEQVSSSKKPGLVKSVPFISHQLETGITIPGKKTAMNPQEWRDFCKNDLHWLNEQVQPEFLLCSVVNLLDGSDVGLTVPDRGYKPPKPKPRPKPRSTWLQLNEDPSEEKKLSAPVPVARASKSSDEVEDKKAEMQKEINEAKRKVAETEFSLKVLSEKLVELQEESAQLSGGDKAREISARKLALSKVQGGQGPEAVAKVEHHIAAAVERTTELARQWDAFRTPLVEQLRAARSLVVSNENVNERLLEGIKETRNKIEALTQEVASKQQLKARLEDDLSKVPREINRSMYTRRILEIIKNIQKQQRDIDKILVDTRQVKKDISQMTGRLERSFAVTNEHIFLNAKKDEASRKAYKLLATLHSDCNEIVSMIQETGAIVREISDLNEHIEIESGRKIAASLERISIDLQQMKPETEMLKKQLAALTK